MTANYKSPPSRLARLFKESREKWKKKALDRQKKLEAADIKVRDLEKSRDKWKQEAKELAKQNKQLERDALIRQAEAEKEKKR
jgi:membrane protein involved in colicin uptake